MSAPAVHDEILTTAQAALRAGVAPSTVRHWVRDGLLPATKHGRDLAIRPADLDALQRRPRGWQMGRPRKERA